MKHNRVSKAVCGTLLMAILLGTVGYCWTNSGTEGSVSVGYSYDLPIIDETGLTGTTIDPTKTGKLTIVNFWGTWCTPCIEELPYFDQIAKDYPEDLQVIAVHTDMLSETAPEFIEKYYPNTNIIFAKDDNQDGTENYFRALGGRDTYPYTVVLDNNGNILKSFVGKLHYQDLLEIIE